MKKKYIFFIILLIFISGCKKDMLVEINDLIEKPQIYIENSTAYLVINNLKVSSAWIQTNIEVNEKEKIVLIKGKYILKEIPQKIKIELELSPNEYKYFWIDNTSSTISFI